jgi:hypothetical protein
MNFLLRFGRRVAIPSTVGIRAEYKAYAAKEDLRMRWAQEEGLPALARWDEIIAHRAARLALAAPVKAPSADAVAP